MAPYIGGGRAPQGAWHATAVRRRIVLGFLVAAQTVLAVYFMAGALPYNGRAPLETALLVVFAPLFAWVSCGFWTALAGFLVLLSGDRQAISRRLSEGPLDPTVRTALVMPICNENVERVFAGLRATCRSLERAGAAAHFDVFVLSDSGDPDIRASETAAWLDLRRELGPAARVFYRWRANRIKKKAGNVADFCRRWGRRYRYMVVLDADSVMSGDCLAALVRLMEANPRAGIIQTAPRAAGRETLYARVQQFAGAVYGPLFTAGMHYWQLGEAHYWGHNAIIRVAPFMAYCALGRLPGRGPFSGEILSHDFVEAALMRRAGWGVWIAYDLPGSYEEVPPSLLEELKRDGRWCRGNLINARLIGARGLHAAHRFVFATGVMAYLAAPLWLMFLALATAHLAKHALVPPSYFVEPRQLFPLWPEWNVAWALGLLGATAFLLLVPKLLAVGLALGSVSDGHGGRLRLVASAALEIVFSALLAPVRMLFHSGFVLRALGGRAAQWRSPAREDTETPWVYAARRHGWQAALGLAWMAFAYAVDPGSLRWLLPVAGAMVLAVPVSVATSRVSLGRRLREAGLFLIPEEVAPPTELADVARRLRRHRGYPGFALAVREARWNARFCAVRAARAPAVRQLRSAELVARARSAGPDGLGTRGRMRLLSDPIALAQLHAELAAGVAAHPGWRRPVPPCTAEMGYVPPLLPQAF
jgi:membrane glycosyltransferase